MKVLHSWSNKKKGKKKNSEKQLNKIKTSSAGGKQKMKNLKATKIAKR